MGWRDRVKKSFADSAHIAEGDKNLKNQENNNKKGLKTSIIYLTHNTQNTQNEGKKPKLDQGNTTSKVKDQSTPEPTPAADIPAPEPPGMGAEYHRIWNQAWTLADYIDDPDGAPLAERRAKLPELDRLRARMAAICRNPTNKPAPPAGPDPEPAPPATRDPTPDTCPAKCKRSGKCYGKAYFEGKAGRAAECMPDGCKHIKGKEVNGTTNERQYNLIREENQLFIL
jgi:hypothetical protein